MAAPIAVTRPQATTLAQPQTGIVAAGKSAGTATGLGRPSTDMEGVWNGPDMPGEMVGVAVVDLDGYGVVETVSAFTNKVLIGSLAGGQYKGQGFIDIPKRTRLVGIDAADLDGNGRPELYISAVKLDISRDIEVVASLVAEEVNGQYRIIADDIPYFLRRVDIPWEETVIAAQRAADTERTYGGKVYRLQRQGDDFDNGAEIDFGTGKLTANGFLPIQSDDQRVVVLFDINERLEVVKLTGKKIWDSDEVLGGSSAYILREDPNARGDKLKYYLKANLDRMPDGTILVPVNKGDDGMFSSKVFSESLLAGLVWDGDSLEEAWHTDPKGGYLADFQVADVDNDDRDEIVTALVRGIGDDLVQSKLVVYELP
ncbi:MAG: hypothetical protein C0623_01695 [Desulfuromonas sp.]|nr:MAG: hypothetical protein C0623_01695 [Desulfuromonas sp.]